jgi:adenosylcobinamide-GDP ribazoletransferase
LTLLACLLPPAKDEGLGSLIVSTSGVKELVIATVTGLAPAVFLFRMQVLYASAGLAISLLLSIYAWRKIGGLTGDILGACLEITELATLFAFLP